MSKTCVVLRRSDRGAFFECTELIFSQVFLDNCVAVFRVVVAGAWSVPRVSIQLTLCPFRMCFLENPRRCVRLPSDATAAWPRVRGTVFRVVVAGRYLVCRFTDPFASVSYGHVRGKGAASF